MLEIDIECFSSASLQKGGVYRYSESEDFEILLFSYSLDGGAVEVIDLASGEKIPEDIIRAITDDNVIKIAHNAMFERICLSRFLGLPTGTYLNPKSWQCTMIMCAYMGLPLSLEGAGAVLGLEKQKLSVGKDLIRYFCVPCRPTKANGGRVRNLPKHDPERWKLFKEYNKRDVETEMAIKEKLSKFPVPDFVWDEYHQDQEINDRGILVDMPFVKQAMAIDGLSKDTLTTSMKNLTNLDNPNSVSQMKSWLTDKGIEVDTLGKRQVKEMLKDADGDVEEALLLRQQISKSSVRKYAAMENAICSDDRVRGLFQFYGANRTGRTSGRLVQFQNLPMNTMPDLAEARDLVKDGNIQALSLLYDDIPDVLSQLIRTAFIPKEGKKFYVSDFSAIEARVLAWLAGEDWRTKVFVEGGDIYCASASKMFKVPVEKHGINGELRQKGKKAELACGYGGSIGALKNMGALELGLTEDELKPLVDAWRGANPHIVDFWWKIGSAVETAIRDRAIQEICGIKFTYRSGMLFITLPSGRNLAYVKPRLEGSKFGRTCVTYEGVGATKKWERIESYGPKFVENIVQGISRDILMYALSNLRKMDIVAHVHDEIIIEADPSTPLEEVCKVMSKTPSWAENLVLRADGYVCNFYQKD